MEIVISQAAFFSKSMTPLEDRTTAENQNRKTLPASKTSPFVPAGQSTQMIIGATPENDYELLKVTQTMYQQFDLKTSLFLCLCTLEPGQCSAFFRYCTTTSPGTPSLSGRLAVYSMDKNHFYLLGETSGKKLILRMDRILSFKPTEETNYIYRSQEYQQIL